MTRLDRSSAFTHDVGAAVQWYIEEAGAETALRLVDEVERSVRSGGAKPGLGSRHYADVAGVPGIRSRAVEGFPYVILFIARGHDVVTLVRMLHTSRDIGESLREFD